MCGTASATAKYVGSETCMSCHLKQYNDFVLSGHPYKLRTASDAKVAGVPLPEGYTWDDISYVIGGRNWKVRYMDKKGYIITMTGKNRERISLISKTGSGLTITPARRTKSITAGDVTLPATKKQEIRTAWRELSGHGHFRVSSVKHATVLEPSTLPLLKKGSQPKQRLRLTRRLPCAEDVI